MGFNLEVGMNRTIASYDRMAPDFVARLKRDGFWDAPIEPAFSKFTAALTPGALVLDIGCGPGRDTNALQSAGFKVVGVDLSIGMLRQAQTYQSAPFVQGDMLRLPFGNEAVDGVWMCASLLHIPRQFAPQVLSEVRRVLKSDGCFYVAVKQGDGEEITNNLGERHFIYYQSDVFVTMVKQEAFTVSEHWVTGTEQSSWINVLALENQISD